jgi:hypothetical protein
MARFTDTEYGVALTTIWGVLWSPRAAFRRLNGRVRLPVAAILMLGVWPQCAWVAIATASRDGLPVDLWVVAFWAGMVAETALWWVVLALVMHLLNRALREPSDLKRLAVAMVFAQSPVLVLIPVGALAGLAAAHASPGPHLYGAGLARAMALYRALSGARDAAPALFLGVWPVVLLGCANAYGHTARPWKGWIAWSICVAVPAIILCAVALLSGGGEG